MCADSKQNAEERQPRVLRHLAKWKLLYQTAGVASVVLSVAVAIIVGGLSLRQTQEAMTIAVSSLELQQAEFMLRNRPLVVIGNHGFSGPTEASGEALPRSVTVQLLNVSEITATQLQGTMHVRLNGQAIGDQRPLPTDLPLVGDLPRMVVLGLSEETYSAATDPSNEFEITTTLTYSGMLGEQPDQYSTRVVVYWSPTDGRFMSTETSYE